LVKDDLQIAKSFGLQLKRPWIYLVDTSENPIPNPLNLFYLRRIKKLPYIKNYIIYAPSLLVRLFIFLTNFIIKPDKIISEESEYLSYINQSH